MSEAPFLAMWHRQFATLSAADFLSFVIFHKWAQRTSEIFFHDKKRNFVSPCGHVIFYLSNKHQWKPNHFTFENDFLQWKAHLLCSHGNCDISLVKITCYFHMWRNHVFVRKLAWFFIGVYIIIIYTKKFWLAKKGVQFSCNTSANL